MYESHTVAYLEFRSLFRFNKIVYRLLKCSKEYVVDLRGTFTSLSYSVIVIIIIIIIIMIRSYAERYPVARIWMTSLETTLTLSTLTGDWVYPRGNIPLYHVITSPFYPHPS
jgi:hypothetical protein